MDFDFSTTLEAGDLSAAYDSIRRAVNSMNVGDGQAIVAGWPFENIDEAQYHFTHDDHGFTLVFAPNKKIISLDQSLCRNELMEALVMVIVLHANKDRPIVDGSMTSAIDVERHRIRTKV